MLEPLPDDAPPDAFYLTFRVKGDVILDAVDDKVVIPEKGAAARFRLRFGCPPAYSGLRGGYYCCGPIRNCESTDGAAGSEEPIAVENSPGAVE